MMQHWLYVLCMDIVSDLLWLETSIGMWGATVTGEGPADSCSCCTCTAATQQRQKQHGCSSQQHKDSAWQQLSISKVSGETGHN